MPPALSRESFPKNLESYDRFLLFVDEPVTAIRRAACTSGDSDSIACLAGAFGKDAD